MTDDWLVWQLVDSAFPGGALAHSGGLEAAYQSGMISTRQRLPEFFDAQLRAVSYAAIPFMRAAFKNFEAWAEVDRSLDIFLSNHVANRASRAQGATFLAAAQRIFQPPRLIELREQLRREKGPGHLAPILGVCLSGLGISESKACQIMLFLTVRAAVSSSVRLGIVGPLEAQTIQYQLAGNIDRWAVRAMEISIDTAANTSPMLDLLQGTQDRLYSRLFQS